tara:strand:+ start:7458 stop:7979 length:522 start_codon:yes stop_codon:yes gene_type:complete
MSVSKKDTRLQKISFPQEISIALRKDYQHKYSAVKHIGRDTGLGLRSIKSWYEGTRAPSTEHLIILAKVSPSVFTLLLQKILMPTLGGGHSEPINYNLLKTKNVPINVPIKFNDRQSWFLKALETESKLKAKDIAEKFEVCVKTAKRDIRELQKFSKIKFFGAKKNGYYEILK